MIRGIYPVVATITAEGFTRLEDEEIASRFASLVDVLSSRATSLRVSETSSDTRSGDR